MYKIQFPQINRKLTASLGFIVFIAYLGLNIWMEKAQSNSYENNLEKALLLYPTNSFFHEELGRYYLGKDNLKAEREYSLAQKYYQPQSSLPEINILGTQSPPESDMLESLRAGSPWQTWLNYIEKKQNLDKEIQYWEKVSQIYPDYIYADMKLATLFAEKRDRQKAKSRLEKILSIDPLNQKASFLLLQIK